MCDRYGGAAAWDARCDRLGREREKILEHATCEDCAHFHAFNGGASLAGREFDSMLDALGIPASPLTRCARSRIVSACATFVCDVDGVEEMSPGETPNGLKCDLFEPR